MSFALRNHYLQAGFDPLDGTWSVTSRHAALPAGLTKLSLALHWRRRDNWALRREVRWNGFSSPEQGTEPSPHGQLATLEFTAHPQPGSPQLKLKFALPEAQPFILWQLAVSNASAAPIYIDRLEMLHAPDSPGVVDLGQATGSTQNLAFFSQGWQSWSYSGAYGAGDRFRRSRLGPLRNPLNVNAGTPQPTRRGRFASDMFAVLGNRRQRVGLVLGFLSQAQHFGTVYCQLDQPFPALQMWANGDGVRLDPGAQIMTDWACLSFLHLDEPDPLAHYLQAVWRQNLSDLNGSDAGEVADSLPHPDQANPPAGWCSWYHYFQNVTAEDVRGNLQAGLSLRDDLPLDLWQIDDGFEMQVGDWFSFRPTFPQGVAPLAEEIRAAGCQPGLWLAPFILQPGSRLAQEHPDWLLRGKLGRPVNAGFLWNSITTALDLTHPEALAYACQVVGKAAHAWGFSYLKLDFLYAAALPGRRRDPSLTRAQVLRQGLAALRAAAGPYTQLLGCGCPLGSGIGLVEAMRIGADVDVRWKPAYQGISLGFQDEPDMPAARNAIQNTLTRAALHRRWWINDPDCLLLRPGTELSLDEVRTLASVIALSGGSLLLSDDLTSLPEERWQIARRLLPLIGERPRLVDWLDTNTPARLRLDLENASGRWHLLAAFNWADHPADLTVAAEDYELDPQAEYTYREFWSAESRPWWHSRQIFRQVPAHGVCLLAVRPWQRDLPSYLGSDLHISQGLEVTAWETVAGPTGKETLLRFELEHPGETAGHVDLYVPRPPQISLVNQQPVACSPVQAGIYRLRLAFQSQAKVEVGY